MSAADEHLTVQLPLAVRQRVVGWAAVTLGGLAADEVPPMLKAVARFTPSKRGRSGATALAAALEGDPLFRQRVAVWTRADQPELSRAVDAGEALPAADPLDLAALAYILRPPGWTSVVRRAAEEAEQADRVASQAQAQVAVARLSHELAAARAEGKAEVDRVKSEAAGAAAAADQLRRQLRKIETELRTLRADTGQTLSQARQTALDAREAVSAAEAEGRRLRVRLVDAEASLNTVRRATREGRQADGIRLRLLLDTVVEAAHGLRRELALPPLPGQLARPADSVAAVGAVTPDPAGVTDLAARGLAADDPALLDRLLDLPQVHLVVDGYNVTKSGYGTLTLAEQRNRLISGLAALASRTRAEITCVFDGTTLDTRVIQTSPRGVRVLFSQEGDSADELIVRLVRAEPPGRPVVVVSSDREVADGARAGGARAIPARLLVRRLDRV